MTSSTSSIIASEDGSDSDRDVDATQPTADDLVSSSEADDADNEEDEDVQDGSNEDDKMPLNLSSVVRSFGRYRVCRQLTETEFLMLEVTEKAMRSTQKMEKKHQRTRNLLHDGSWDWKLSMPVQLHI